MQDESKQIKRDQHGKFAKGQSGNPASMFAPGPGAAERGRSGGIKSGETRRYNKSIADALRAILAEKIDGDVDKLDAITAKVVKKMFDNPDIRDLKVLAEILGELACFYVTVPLCDAGGLTLNINASDEGAQNISKLINGKK